MNNILFMEIDAMDICTNPEPLQVLLFAKYIVFVIKILIPICLILFPTIDFIKMIASNDTSSMNKTLSIFVKRLIAGIIVFFLPTIISVLLSLVNADFKMCEENLSQEKINELKQQILSE